MNIDKALNVEELRGRFLEHTRRAYRLLPLMEKPRILDVGCGLGQQTMELARLSKGEVVGIDIHHPAVSGLQRLIDQADAGDRINAIQVSLYANIDEPIFSLISAHEFITKVAIADVNDRLIGHYQFDVGILMPVADYGLKGSRRHHRWANGFRDLETDLPRGI